MIRAGLLTALRLAGGLLICSLAAQAGAPDYSLRPEARPGAPVAAVLTSGSAQAVTRSLRPRARPPVRLTRVFLDPSDRSGLGPVRSARPVLRPSDLRLTGRRPPVDPVRTTPGTAAPVVPHRSARRDEDPGSAQPVRAAGRLCRVRGIEGETAGRIPGAKAGCGIRDAVRVTAVSGITLSRPALMDCPTAKALKDWVDDGMVPAMRRIGRVSEIRVAAHYACRTRNNRPGARLSEHAKGKAIDISGFELQDGRVITVLLGWNDRRSGRALRQMHKAACGPFGTVLGPEADRYHRDHFHFDTAEYRSGPYCR